MSETESMNAPANDNAAAARQNAADYAGGKGALSAAERDYFTSRGASGLPAADGSAELSAAEPAKQVKTVPHGALHAERAEHKKTRAELQEMQEKARAWQRDLAAYAQNTPHMPLQQANAAEQPIAPPDPREDFLGFARWQGEEISRLNQALAAERSRAETARQAEATEAALAQEWENAVSAARAEHEDIDDALEFLQQARLSQLGVLAAADSRFADKAFCEKQIYAELRDIIISTFQQGVNPAETVYNIAKAYGYGRDETARMGKISAALSSARSLAAGAGSPAGDPYLLETVANMPEAEFAKWYAQNKSSFRQLFGG